MTDVELRLAPGELVSIEGSREASIHVHRGEVWATRPGDTTDYILTDGQSLALGMRGATVVKAFRDTLVSVRRAARGATASAPKAYSSNSCTTAQSVANVCCGKSACSSS